MRPLASPWLRSWLRRVAFSHVPGMITCRELEAFVEAVLDSLWQGGGRRREPLRRR
ncbi:MAG: hypothetical protein MI824_11015 [Hyphomicrobiales bacterium]|nr:hypothetical protein [Hyphomicrobiales bacterium]